MKFLLQILFKLYSFLIKMNIINNIDLQIINRSKNILFQKYFKIISYEKEKIDKLENK